MDNEVNSGPNLVCLLDVPLEVPVGNCMYNL